MDNNYYRDRLSAERLKRCYGIGSPRIQQYLQSEIGYVARHIHEYDHALELGCGYGRAMKPLLGMMDTLVGIDTSLSNLTMAHDYLADEHYKLALMNAASMAFRDDCFDLVYCIQNGLSAFGEDQTTLIREATRVTRPGGMVLFSSYIESFWEDRLTWFRMQAAAGLLGPIDESATGDGTIICQDGFRATTVTPADFRRLADELSLTIELREVDNSSLFGIIKT